MISMASTIQQLHRTATAASQRQLPRSKAPTNVLQAAPPAVRGAAAGAAPRRRSAPPAALPSSRAAAMELEECPSEAEDWVFTTACEGAACWQPDGMEAVPATIGARVEMPPGLANSHGSASGVAHTDGNRKLAGAANNGNGAVHKPRDEGPMDQDALDAWRATMDVALGDGGAGLPEDEQLRSRESLLLSVDGMVGNWELYGIPIASGSFSDEEEWAVVAPAAALPVDVAASGEYAALLAEVQQLAESTRLAGRLSTASGAGSRAAASGAPVIDIE